jgi:Flp pilus assembly protein TadB
VSRSRLTGPRRVAERRRENLDILLGFLGFFTIALLVATVSAELHGHPSVAQALALAVLVGLIFVVLRMRRELDRQARTVVPTSPEKHGSPGR